MSRSSVSPTDLRWICGPSGKWHAWPLGGRATLCGKINMEHIRGRPVTAITDTAPASMESACRYCAKHAGLALTPAHQDPAAAAWLGVLRRHCTHERIQAVEGPIVALAELLAQFGCPQDPPALALFQQLRDFILEPRCVKIQKPGGSQHLLRTLPQLKAVMALLTDKAAVLRVAEALQCWRQITNRVPRQDKFNAERVVETILQIPLSAYAPYIEHLHSRGLHGLAVIFHPNTLDRAKRDTALRGLWAGSSEYWASSEAQLNIVTD